jgi:hypothetical protein
MRFARHCAFAFASLCTPASSDFRRHLTFELSGAWKRAKPAVRCPLERGVGRQRGFGALTFELRHLHPPRLIAALCQRSSLQTTLTFSDWGAARYRSMTADLWPRDIWPAGSQQEQHRPAAAGGRAAGQLACIRPEGAPRALHEPLRGQSRPGFAARFARGTSANHYLSFAGAQRST